MYGEICFLRLSSLELGSQFKVIPRYCISLLYCARFSRHERAPARTRARAQLYKTSRRMSLKLSMVANKKKLVSS